MAAKKLREKVGDRSRKKRREGRRGEGRRKEERRGEERKGEGRGLNPLQHNAYLDSVTN